MAKLDRNDGTVLTLGTVAALAVAGVWRYRSIPDPSTAKSGTRQSYGSSNTSELPSSVVRGQKVRGDFATFDDFSKEVRRVRLRNKNKWWGANATVAGRHVTLKAFGNSMASGRYRVDGVSNPGNDDEPWDWTPGYGDESVKEFNWALAEPFKSGSKNTPSTRGKWVELRYRKVRATPQQSRGYYNDPIILQVEPKGYKKSVRINTSAGSRDSVSVFQYDDYLYVLSVNTGLDYVGLHTFHIEDGKADQIGDIFLDQDESIRQVLGPRGLNLTERNMVKRLSELTY